MGRALQKRKNRSSVPKVRHKPKSKKLDGNVRANPIIAANWDRGLSVAQNYRKLGLTARLNNATGGTERHGRVLGRAVEVGHGHREQQDDEEDEEDEEDPLAIGPRKKLKVEVGEAIVKRDPKTGETVVLYDDDGGSASGSGSRRPRPRPKPNPLNDPLNDIEDGSDEGGEAYARAHVGSGGTRRGVVPQLEELAARGEESRPRKQSRREQEWIGRLVRRHGADYRAMSRDARLNPMQQSEGDIRARVRKWEREREREQQGSARQVQHSDSTGSGRLQAQHHSTSSGEAMDDTQPSCNCTKRWEEITK